MYLYCRKKEESQEERDRGREKGPAERKKKKQAMEKRKITTQQKQKLSLYLHRYTVILTGLPWQPELQHQFLLTRACWSQQAERRSAVLFQLDIQIENLHLHARLQPLSRISIVTYLLFGYTSSIHLLNLQMNVDSHAQKSMQTPSGHKKKTKQI